MRQNKRLIAASFIFIAISLACTNSLPILGSQASSAADDAMDTALAEAQFQVALEQAIQQTAQAASPVPQGPPPNTPVPLVPTETPEPIDPTETLTEMAVFTPTVTPTPTEDKPLQNGQCLKSSKNTSEVKIINNANQNVFIWAKWGGLEDRLYVCEVPPGEFTLWLEPHHYDAVSFVCNGKSTFAGAFYFQRDKRETLTIPWNACGN